MRKITTVFACCSAFLAACTSTQNTLDSDPYFSFIYEGSKEDLVSCVTSKLIVMDGVTYNVATRPSDSVTIIAVNISDTSVIGTAINERLGLLLIDGKTVRGQKTPLMVSTLYNVIEKDVKACSYGEI